MFELLKRHLCLEGVSAMPWLIDLDLDIRALAYPVLRSTKAFWGSFQGTLCLMYIAAIGAQAEVAVFEAEGCYVLRWSWLPKALYVPKVTKGRWFEAATPACAWDCAIPLRSCIPSFTRRSVFFGKLRRATAPARPSWPSQEQAA